MLRYSTLLSPRRKVEKGRRRSCGRFVRRLLDRMCNLLGMVDVFKGDSFVYGSIRRWTGKRNV